MRPYFVKEDSDDRSAVAPGGSRTVLVQLQLARRRCRIQTAVMADRVQVSRPTLRRLENGNAGVGIGAYATALYVLCMIERVGDLADIAQDPVGQRLASEDLPDRISSK